jgi:hypothetical protein
MGRGARERTLRPLTILDAERRSNVADRWRVVIKVEVECLRGDSPQSTAIVSKQDSTWGAISGSPGQAFEEACAEGFISYTEALPKLSVVKGVVQ